MTKEQLRQYRYLKKEIMLLQEEIERLRASLQAIPQPDGMPHSNYATDRTSDVVSKIVDLEALLHRHLRTMIELRGEIESCIVALPSDQRLLMRWRYIEGHKWEAIALEMNYSYMQVCRIHGRILQKIAAEKML